MIKKNTKIIIEGEKSTKLDSLQGGIPLSKGEVIVLHEGNMQTSYKVTNKTIDCYFEKEDQIVNITYTLKKRN
jgi:hypothetical protein